MDQTIMKASYAYGPVTVAVSNNDFDHTTTANDQEVRSYSLAYTLTDSISVSYGEETFDRSNNTVDIEVSGISGSYTSGGMTLGLLSYDSKNNDHTSTSANNDNSYWQASLSFAF